MSIRGGTVGVDRGRRLVRFAPNGHGLRVKGVQLLVLDVSGRLQINRLRVRALADIAVVAVVLLVAVVNVTRRHRSLHLSLRPSLKTRTRIQRQP